MFFQALSLRLFETQVTVTVCSYEQKVRIQVKCICCKCIQVLHLHIWLYLLAQLFLEQGINIYCWVKNDDHSKFSGVSYDEALTVVEFWSVSDPKSSCPLIHLSEVYCVCETRMYYIYTVLLRQAAANCSCMEIQIAHPLVQLPAG